VRILIVDDEPAIPASLGPVLGTQGHTVSVAGDAACALRFARDEVHELVLLDLGLPDADGIDILPRLKELGAGAVIVLSARYQEADKVRALDAGADDYINKPFGIDELLARVRAAERRLKFAPSLTPDVFEAHPLKVDFPLRQVWLFGEEVKLSPKEFDLLQVLCADAGRVVTHRKLLIAGWDDPNADGQYLRSYVALLRQKLEFDPSEPELLLTEPGVGYRLALSP
jgi:two-component system, OmpR family, KDP operon response regulator KdpE